MPIVYGELHALAERALRSERSDHTLCTTALVHEAYLRLVDQRDARWVARAQFLAVAAQVMRRILVDHARARLAAKRTPGGSREILAESRVPMPDCGGDILALHEALERLAAADPQAARIVELRYFGGMTVEEAAEAAGVSPATVKRDWVMAKAWLRRELSGARA
jgi:RNA polymerase sigma factor (TIGR02999 family)